MSGIKEVMPRAGLLFQEQMLNPVLCKPKLLPLKSVTLERLERMQKDAHEKMWELEKELVKAEEAEATESAADKVEEVEKTDASRTDVWRADEEQPQDDGDGDADPES